MRILWVGTKAPWPPVDGGRLLVWYTLEALAQAGHPITLVVPVDPATADTAAIENALRPFCRPVLVKARPTPWSVALAKALATGKPATLVRHTLPAVREEVERLLKAEAFDVVHAEQVHALAQCEPAFAAGLRVTWRAQNIESDLWAGWAKIAGFSAPFFRREARFMGKAESEAVRRTSVTIALTSPDADRLRTLSGSPERIHHVPAPFPAELPQADRPLPGSAAVVLFGSAGWHPNEEGARWFVRQVWPRVLETLPEAQLHVFGGRAPASRGVVFHDPPVDSREAFAPGSILVVPLHVASGVRMKILEAWARGIPVVATPEGTRGTATREQARIETEPEAFAQAITAAARNRAAHHSQARAQLESHHAPSIVGDTLGRILGGA